MEIDIKHLQSLSKLKLEDEEVESFTKDLQNIIEFVDEITKLDLPEEDKSRAVALSELRQDEIEEKTPCDVLANAPKKKDGCFVTPLVVE